VSLSVLLERREPIGVADRGGGVVVQTDEIAQPQRRHVQCVVQQRRRRTALRAFAGRLTVLAQLLAVLGGKKPGPLLDILGQCLCRIGAALA